ncbi:MAG: maleylpyruvate isomerase N-terminal domain-containing protein [Microthrixaceae bacterium]
MRNQFLVGAEVVRSAVADRRVAEAWDEPSNLAGQTIGSLASHLARGAVWVVLDYLDAQPGPGVDFETAAEYFAEVTQGLTEDDHAAIRGRGATVAEAGPAQVARRLADSVEQLRARLPGEPDDRRVAVYAGKVMRLDDYLLTRIVEQVVHLDDLARSLDIEPWANPPDAAALVVSCGAEIGRQLRGDSAMIRALFREGAGDVLPVLAARRADSGP